MKILDFLNRDSIIANLAASGKEEVLGELADQIARVELVNRDDVYKILWDREQLGSTGIGDGVAIPHGTMASINQQVALFARSIDGVDFDAIDGEKTHIFFVLLTPDNNVGLQALARVSRLLRSEVFLESLLSSADGDSLYQTIADGDDKLKGS